MCINGPESIRVRKLMRVTRAIRKEHREGGNLMAFLLLQRVKQAVGVIIIILRSKTRYVIGGGDLLGTRNGLVQIQLGKVNAECVIDIPFAEGEQLGTLGVVIERRDLFEVAEGRLLVGGE